MEVKRLICRDYRGGGEIKGLLPPVEDEVNRYFGGTSVGGGNRCQTEVEAVATHLRK